MGHNGGPPLEDAVPGFFGRLVGRILGPIGILLGSTGPTAPSSMDEAHNFPSDPSQLGHIFRDAPGHFTEDTPGNRAAIQLTISPANYSHIDQFGNAIYGQTNANGTQTWAQVRGGTIQNAGINQTPQNLMQRFPQ
jgi:hypothetical protein